MSLNYHQFAIGQTLLVLAQRNFVKPIGQKVTAADVPSLHLVRLEITEEVVVNGDWRPEEQHYGYRAKGSDGWMYQCQAEHFDDASFSPYNNWQRSFIQDTHYTVGADGRIDNWLIPKQEFRDHYLNWEVTSLTHHLDDKGQEAMVARVIAEFPDCELAQCDKHPDIEGRRPFHYVKDGCGLCALMNRKTSTSDDMLPPMPGEHSATDPVES